MIPQSRSPRRSIRTHLMSGVAAAVLLTGGVGGWAATTQISGAVIAPGILVVDSNLKKIQHPTGGVVAKVMAVDGDHVKAGQILVRLDDTQTRANLAIINKDLDENSARQSRDEAERDGADHIEFSEDLLSRKADAGVDRLLRGEIKLFKIRQTARAGQMEQLRQRIVQSKEEIEGLRTQQTARLEQVSWIEKELAGINELWAQNLVPYSRLTALEREASRLRGESGQLLSSIAQTKGKITETELQILQIDQDMRAEVGKDIAEIRAKTSELIEKGISAKDMLKRTDIRAPQDGIVLQSAVHTVGGVISAGEQIMLIVPEGETLKVEAKIQPQEIDQIRLGQPVSLRFSAFNQRTTPEINGTIGRVGADVTQNQKTEMYYYTIRISIPDSELARLGHVKLVAGMPVEAFIRTTNRNVMSYLVKPLQDQVTRAFREN